MVNGYVSPLVTALTCTLQVNTFTSASSSAVNWFELANALPIDGGTTSKYRGYDGFFTTH